MTFADSTLRTQRWVLAAMLLGSAAIMVPGAALTEPFMLPKITFMLACALALVGLWAARALQERRTSLPVSAAGAAVLAFVLALAVATAVSPRPWTSVIGYFSRYTGLVPYLVHVVAMLAALRLVDLPFGRTLLRTGVVSLTVVAGYGLFQAAGLDPVDYTDVSLGATFSTMGNTNFGGAWAGAALAFAVATALSSEEERGWRVFAAVLVPFALVYVVLTGTSQGPLVAAAAAATAAAVLLSEERHPVRQWVRERRRIALAAAAATALALAGAVGAASSFLRTQLDQALVERPQFWAAAVDVWRDNPLLGTGLDTFAFVFLRYRPAEHAVVHGTGTTDAPHSVPLGMLSNGGLLLFGAWATLVVLVLVAVVRGLRRVHGPERAVLAGFTGVLVGYLLQSLVSFDQPPLALLFFLSSGAVLALAWPPAWREVRLPGTAPAPKLNRRGKPVGPVQVPGSTRALQAATAAILLAVMWFGLMPLRADRIAAQGAPLSASGRVPEAVAKLERASELNPGEGRYYYIAAQLLQQVGDGQGALDLAERAARRDPGPAEYSLLAARQAEALGDLETADRWYARVARQDPNDPLVLNELALFRLKQEQPEVAVELLERSRALKDDTENLVLLAQVRLQLSDTAGAVEALETALVVQPSNSEAAQLLEEIRRNEAAS
jgi:O-antigen ligase/cytochrome c-type biogenesis protein CcmH/NrfG